VVEADADARSQLYEQAWRLASSLGDADGLRLRRNLASEIAQALQARARARTQRARTSHLLQ